MSIIYHLLIIVVFPTFMVSISFNFHKHVCSYCRCCCCFHGPAQGRYLTVRICGNPSHLNRAAVHGRRQEVKYVIVLSLSLPTVEGPPPSALPPSIQWPLTGAQGQGYDRYCFTRGHQISPMRLHKRYMPLIS